MSNMASEDIAKLAETLAQTQVAGGQLSFKGKSLKLNTAEDGEFLQGLAQGRKGMCAWALALASCQTHLAALSRYLFPQLCEASLGPSDSGAQR